jgi:hypothetical protein
MRLRALEARRGRRKAVNTDIMIADVSAFLGVGVDTLRHVARKKREVDDGLQLQLSSFFTLVDAGVLVKRHENGVPVIVRIPPPPGAPPAARATIDLSGQWPRVKWSR